MAKLTDLGTLAHLTTLRGVRGRLGALPREAG